MFDFREQNLCGFEDNLSVLLCIHNADSQMFGLHELILYVFEDDLSVLLYIHIGSMEMFVLHEPIFCMSEDYFSLILCFPAYCLQFYPPFCKACMHHNPTGDKCFSYNVF